MSVIESLQSFSSNLLSPSGQTSSVTSSTVDDTLNSLTEVTSSFSDLLTQSQSEASQQKSTLSLVTDNVTDDISTMQDQLLANLLGVNLGVNSLTANTETVANPSDTFSLDDIKGALQSNILGALQANNIVDSITQTTTEEISSVDDTFTTMLNFSFNEDGIGLEDAFDTVNVLQHIPVVSSIYSAVTEQDKISKVAQLAGGFLYGGATGLAFSMVDLAIESYSGTSISDTVTQFNYSNFIFGQSSDDTDSIASSTDSTNSTLFFDKDKNVVFER